MKLEAKEARNIVWDDHDDWDEVAGTRTEEKNGRWDLLCSAVFCHKTTGKNYMLYWSAGATEMQYQEPYEYENDTAAIEVELKEKVVKAWVKVS